MKRVAELADGFRFSVAIDQDGLIYAGSGDGHLVVVNPDGTGRFTMKLIDAPRDDLNSSPALGKDGVVIAGENGGVFFVPFDYCLSEGLADPRCVVAPKEPLPNEGTFLRYTGEFGGLQETPPAALDPNQPIAYSLFTRKAGDTIASVIDSPTVVVTTTPETAVRVDVSGDRKFLVVTPETTWPATTVTITVAAGTRVNLDRDGLKQTGGVAGAPVSLTATFAVTGPTPSPAFVAGSVGKAGDVLELYRVAAPLPTILPSYNQIGFDSLHYLLSIVELKDGHGVAWGVAGKLEGAGEVRNLCHPVYGGLHRPRLEIRGLVQR